MEAPRKIERPEFEKLYGHRIGMRGSPMLHKEVRWYAGASCAGIVIQDQVDRDYSWVVLGPDVRGEMRAIDFGASAETIEGARDALLESMRKRDFPDTVYDQGD